MEKIFSKAKKDLLLHVVYRSTEMKKEREDLILPEEFLQVSALNLPEGKTFKPHKHNTDKKETTITQESWVVIQGQVKVFFYDINDELISENVLNPGDISITMYGGHNYLSLDNNTLVYEFKTGPYLGQDRDKTLIN